MSKSVNRKNNCTVHFMVNEEDMKELNRRFAMTNFKSKREFYRDSIFKNRIISIDLFGEFRKELRELSSLISRNSANLNQIAKAVNSTGIIYKDDIESIKKALQGELLFLSELREKVSDYIINEVVS
ncbi:conjugative transposon mobilization protein [Streptococcus equi subsp. zooepidemicus Sz35]|uniref:plasmid mobilization relaxosome protein MobC n=1 Tax=Streptococcus equi TaxID=1336 RepID=UPI000499C3B8|nr:plasmid mobilization relaxosome protein MobC [Streptococcus equi]AIA68699.1 mobilization protein [Streptococcus equi subsp. zooepidemicus CY]KIS20129.1 conjugative transposon mobilization protein [Streptococcus equi subsp. zooepidemicus Sz35]MBR7684825.1 plasmid mobilization relaxosome protein MobC [Streptococcus equi subsp. zooepidemicus]MBR7753835.1 plasmid mobilization relaxosome protein MobC [Streptococcus equi subsp. zooepidemicus]MBR7775666.1 plasmid mobilization relaxosome protein Mo